MKLLNAALSSWLAAGLILLTDGALADQKAFLIDTGAASGAVPSSSSLDFRVSKKWTLPRYSNNSAVVFDRYSLALAGGQQRLFIFAAEFHPWRLPVPSLWRDVLQKIRAAGFNTVSIYTHWGLIQPRPDPASIGLDGVNDLDFFLTVAKEEGLFVIVRPGPYINAETTMGGMASWTANIDATLRTNDTAWQDAWKPYIQAISDVVVKHQLFFDPARPNHLHGGSVILVQADNEYETGVEQRAYMKEVVALFKKAGVSVPITYNDPGRDNNFVDIVDLYGFDSYPQRFDCSHPDRWVPMRDDYLEYHMDTNPGQPLYIPEFQGGSYDPFDGPGYGECAKMTNSSFARVANQALVAQRVTLLSLYMVYGGTNWGGLAQPDVYSSYDYGAALNEHRQITDKYTELKRQGHFFQAFPDLAMTEQIIDKPGFNISQAENLEDAKDEVDAKMFRTTVLENPETKSKFYVVRYDNTTESRRIRFALEIESLGETILLGQRKDHELERLIGTNHLHGRDSHMIPVDQQLPGGLLLRFSTSNVYRVTTSANLVVISLDFGPGQLLEYGLQMQEQSNHFNSMHMFSVGSDSTLRKVEGKEWEHVKAMHSDLSRPAKEVRGAALLSRTDTRFMVYGTREGTWIVLAFSPTSSTARDFAAPAKYKSTEAAALVRTDDFVHRFFGQSQDSVIMLNVDLLRNSTYLSTDVPLDTVELWGSVSNDTTAVLMALPRLRYVYWNGEEVNALAQGDTEWFYRVSLPGPNDAKAWDAPKLREMEWRWADSIPEASEEFDDSDWVEADKTTSFNPYAKDRALDTQGVILFASEYGFHGNNLVWRGHFTTPSTAVKDVYIKVEGGRSFAFSAFLNGAYLGSAEANRVESAVGRTFNIPAEILRDGERDNVITVLQDHMGLEMETGDLELGLEKGKQWLQAPKLPRGIIGLSFPSLRANRLVEPKVEWKVQGNLHGEYAPDTVRRSLNEGGLRAEVEGWHLPGFDASAWPTIRDTPAKRRVVFYRTSFSMDVPEGSDVGLSFVFKTLGTKRFRAQLYVNGWQMGKYINNLGPQTKYPIHSGVVNLRGDNVVGVSVWVVGDEDEDWSWDPREGLELEVDHVMSGEPRDGYVLEAAGWSELRGGRS